MDAIDVHNAQPYLPPSKRRFSWQGREQRRLIPKFCRDRNLFREAHSVVASVAGPIDDWSPDEFAEATRIYKALVRNSSRWTISD